MAHFEKGFLMDGGAGYSGSRIATCQLLNSCKKPSEDPKCPAASPMGCNKAKVHGFQREKKRKGAVGG